MSQLHLDEAQSTNEILHALDVFAEALPAVSPNVVRQ